MRKLIVFIACLALIPTTAFAQWINKTEDDPFGGGKSSISMTALTGYGFGFLCKGKEDYRIVYLTVEEAGKEVAGMNFLSPKLKIRVDDNPVVELDATLDSASNRLRVSAEGTEVLTLVKSILTARNRVAVAVEMGGKRFHVNNFGIDGSRTALSKSLRACDLEARPAG